MIKTDNKNKNYVWVDYVDIIHALGCASREKNEDMISSLNELFLNVDEAENNSIKLKKTNKIYEYLIKCPMIKNYDTYIDKNNLKDALVRSYYEFNHEMKRKLSKYFRQFVENEIRGITNETIVNEINNDKELMDYIKKYESFDNFIESKIEKNIDIENRIKEKVKNKDRYAA